MLKECFNDGWTVRKQSNWYQEPGLAVPVMLPHDAMITEPRDADSGTAMGGGYFLGGAYVYEKRFMACQSWKGKAVALEFEGVYQCAEVSLNGQLLTVQPYGYTSFIVYVSCI